MFNASWEQGWDVTRTGGWCSTSETCLSGGVSVCGGTRVPREHAEHGEGLAQVCSGDGCFSLLRDVSLRTESEAA